MNIYILLLSVGADAGPFDLYSDTDGYVSAFETNISKASLLAGFASANCPDGTVYVRIKSVGDCTNYIDVHIEGVPIPSTTTTTSSSTSTTTSTSTSSTSTTTTTSTTPPTTTSTTTQNPFLSYWYFGKYNSPGGVVPIPDETDIDVLSGTLVTNSLPSNPIPVPFNSATDDFLWFAIPTAAGTKSTWYVDDQNQGLIGGPVSFFGNLFPDPVIVTYNSITMYLYISTARTNVGTMIMS